MIRAPASVAPLVATVLVAILAVAACGGERERLSQELAGKLTAAGIEASDVSVTPPHGMVPHTNVDLGVAGDEAAAREACAAVEELALYDGEPPYLVRVTYGSGQVLECGWGKEGPRPSGPWPGAVTPEPSRSATTPGPAAPASP